VTAALDLVPREAPLAPVAALATGEAARRLARRLLAASDAELARLEGVAGPDLLAVTGAEADLPWVDGVHYLGRDPDAPALLLPTAARPVIPAPLLERALLARAPADGTPYAVLPAPLTLVPLGGARPVLRARLAAWIEAAR
jgi:MoxR-vWA-beta-propeller ternary system protein